MSDNLCVVFYFNERPREYMIGRALEKGAKRHGGIDFEMRPKRLYRSDQWEGPDFYADLTLAYGVKSCDLLAEHAGSGKDWGIIDKGYIRGYESKRPRVETYTRISINETYPTNRMEVDSDRWEDAGIQLKPHRNYPEGHILVCGSSQKFYTYFGVGNERIFHAKLIKAIREFAGDNEIIFRGKPSFEKQHGAGKSYGADRVSPPEDSIQHWLEGAKCLVTFASNSACDAIFNGIPAVVIGPHITAPVANRKLSDIVEPTFPKESRRKKWAHRLAYEQWKLEDMSSGLVWEYLLPRIGKPSAWWDFEHEMPEDWETR